MRAPLSPSFPRNDSTFWVENTSIGSGAAASFKNTREGALASTARYIKKKARSRVANRFLSFVIFICIYYTRTAELLKTLDRARRLSAQSLERVFFRLIIVFARRAQGLGLLPLLRTKQQSALGYIFYTAFEFLKYATWEKFPEKKIHNQFFGLRFSLI